MSAAYVEFLNQWQNYLLRHLWRQERGHGVLLDPLDLITHFDFLVNFVDSIHPGFRNELASRGIVPFHADLPMEVIDEQSSGEPTSENTLLVFANNVVNQANEIIDLTMD